MSPALSSECGSVTKSTECAGNRAKKASVHRSSTSNKVTGRQSLSSSTKLSPGNIAQGSQDKGACPSRVHMLQKVAAPFSPCEPNELKLGGIVSLHQHLLDREVLQLTRKFLWERSGS